VGPGRIIADVPDGEPKPIEGGVDDLSPEDREWLDEQLDTYRDLLAYLRDR
jgi:hypothetical protein